MFVAFKIADTKMTEIIIASKALSLFYEFLNDGDLCNGYH